MIEGVTGLVVSVSCIRRVDWVIAGMSTVVERLRVARAVPVIVNVKYGGMRTS